MFTLVVLQSKHTLLQFPVYCTRDRNVLFKSITNNGNEKGGYSHYNKCSLKVLPFLTLHPMENGRVKQTGSGTINPKTGKF